MGGLYAHDPGPGLFVNADAADAGQQVKRVHQALPSVQRPVAPALETTAEGSHPAPSDRAAVVSTEPQPLIARASVARAYLPASAILQNVCVRKKVYQRAYAM